MIHNLFGLDPSPVSHTLAKSVYNINTFFMHLIEYILSKLGLKKTNDSQVAIASDS